MPLLPLLIGDPAGVPEAQIVIEGTSKNGLLEWLSVTASGATAVWVTVKNGGVSGDIRFQGRVPANDTRYFDFKNLPLDCQAGIRVELDESALVFWGAR